ncbi:MAG: hypothetical protein EBZ53_05350 [Verrucomicrobia bacterium]|nr:hypothetical protein [Verrucomicrobiota bacterium]
MPRPWRRRWGNILPERSGSTGEPKGVVLTHRNILSNLGQIEGVLGNLNIGSLLGCLPLFHSFGFTVTLWWPLTGGPRVVTYPSPLDPHALGEVISGHGVELLVTTPTFLRTLMRRAGRCGGRGKRGLVV